MYKVFIEKGISVPDKIAAVGFLLALAFCSSDVSQSKPSQSDQELTQKIDAYLAAGAAKGFSGVVLVARDSKVIFSKGYGWADRGKKIPNTPETVFDIGSNTKQFTAAAILKLVEQEKVTLSDPLGVFFDNLPDDKKEITIHQLLTHTAGLKESWGRDTDQVALDKYLEDVFTSELLSSPGEKYAYSNIGYSLLALIIERASGSQYEEYLSHNLLEPAGLKETGYILPVWKADRIAHGYRSTMIDTGTMVERYLADGVSWNLIGNGGIASTSVDLHKWFLALRESKILSKSSRELLFTPHVAMNPEGTWHYAYGWTIGHTSKEIKKVSHNGSNGIFFSSLLLYPDEDVEIIYSSNAVYDDVEWLGSEVEKMVFDPNYQPEPIPPSSYGIVLQFMEERAPGDVARLPEYFTQQAKHELQDRAVLNRVGLWQMDQHNLDWAIALLELNAGLFPDDGNLWDSLGDAYFRMKQKASAINSYNQALALAPEDGCHWCANSREKLVLMQGQISTKAE